MPSEEYKGLLDIRRSDFGSLPHMNNIIKPQTTPPQSNSVVEVQKRKTLKGQSRLNTVIEPGLYMIVALRSKNREKIRL